MSLFTTIPELKDVSQYVREYTGNPTFDLPESKKGASITIGSVHFSQLEPGRWALAFTPFDFYRNDGSDLYAYRRLLLYNTKIEEKVLKSEAAPYRYDEKQVSDYIGKFSMKINDKEIKVQGIDYDKDIDIHIGNNYTDYIELRLIGEEMNYMQSDAVHVVRDLKARRALAKLWQYFPGSLIATIDEDPDIRIFGVPLDRVQRYDIPVILNHETNKVNISIHDDRLVAHSPSIRNPRFDAARLKNKLESKQSDIDKTIVHLLNSIYFVFDDETDEDLYAHFARAMNYLYHHELSSTQSLWLDNDGHIYVVENDNRSADSENEFIDRWDPNDVLNGLKLEASSSDVARSRFTRVSAF